MASSPPADEQPHLALDGHEQHAGLEDAGEEVEPLLVELDRAREVDLQHDQRRVLVRQRELQHADDRDVAGDLDDHAERDAHQRRRAPAELDHRADQERALLDREEPAQVGQDPRRVRDDVLGEHHRLHRTGPYALHQRLEVHRPVEPDQAADREQREPEAELDAGAELDRQHDQQRETRGAVGVLRGDDADRPDRQELQELELEGSGVLAAVGVQEQVAAAADDAGVDGQPDAVRRLEAELQVREAEVAVAVRRERQVRVRADVLDDRGDRAELCLDRAAEVDRETAAGEADPDGDRLDLDRPELDVRGDLHLEPAAAGEPDALAGRPGEAELELGLQPEPAHQRAEEAVGAGERDDELAAPDAAGQADVAGRPVRRAVPGEQRPERDLDPPRREPAAAHGADQRDRVLRRDRHLRDADGEVGLRGAARRDHGDVRGRLDARTGGRGQAAVRAEQDLDAGRDRDRDVDPVGERRGEHEVEAGRGDAGGRTGQRGEEQLDREARVRPGRPCPRDRYAEAGQQVRDADQQGGGVEGAAPAVQGGDLRAGILQPAGQPAEVQPGHLDVRLRRVAGTGVQVADLHDAEQREQRLDPRLELAQPVDQRHLDQPPGQPVRERLQLGRGDARDGAAELADLGADGEGRVDEPADLLGEQHGVAGDRDPVRVRLDRAGEAIDQLGQLAGRGARGADRGAQRRGDHVVGQVQAEPGERDQRAVRPQPVGQRRERLAEHQRDPLERARVSHRSLPGPSGRASRPRAAAPPPGRR